MELLKVDLSPEDAERFKQFLKYYTQFSSLISVGVFDKVQPGQVILHLDASGHIGKIELHPAITVVIHN